MPKNKANRQKKPSGGNNQAGNFASDKPPNHPPTKPQQTHKPNESNRSSVRSPSLDKWLQSNIENYTTKSQTMLDSIFDSKNSNDVAKKYEDLVSFVHDSLAHVRKLMDTRNDSSDFEGTLAKVECSEMRRDKHVRYLTSPCQRWWLMPDELFMELPRTYKSQEPWKGLQDERTACQFVEEFIEMVMPYCRITRHAIQEFMVRLRCDLSDDIDEFLENMNPKGTFFVDWVKKFIDTFSNETVHCQEIIDFNADYPDDRAVFVFVQFWLGRFRFNPKVHPCWVIDKLIEKLPHRYLSPLLRLKLDQNSDVSYSNISTMIYNQAAKLKDPISAERDYLGYRVSSSRLRSIKQNYSVEVLYATDEMDNTYSDYEIEDEDSSDEGFGFFVF